jgi:hypothetical protein
MNIYEAAYMLKTSTATIQRLCRGIVKNNNYILKYGAKIRLCTRTKSTVELLEKGKVIKTFVDVTEASTYFNIKESLVRRLCKNGGRNTVLPIGTYLRLGKKIQIVLEPKEQSINPLENIVFQDVPKINIENTKPIEEKNKTNTKPIEEKNKTNTKPIEEKNKTKQNLFPKINTENMFDDVDL